ncbi:MFS transporter L2 [Exophiala dermatitidis]|uniref:DNA repair protein RAD50 n=1 Tax=Exophiala dermatitidis (strain ATCC 34100 / CBS 525.76 / NIH/UT8656) TaxID=858893 RepID=H6C6E1_EXODN|nr:DNA repair protein RAD50 [Exophiala dermatitidis NIH/UT8656]EHY59287.1 DNA repair protein RAD50 [Exophiala dermatitidis NIH/UT8656]
MAQRDMDRFRNAHLVQESLNVPGWKPSRQEVMIMLTLAIISLMVSLDATVIITSLSTIVQALNATATQGFWIGTSYLLTCAVTMPFIASLSDILGRPRCLLASIVTFTIGTILCAAARTITVMLVGRCVQGIGGGGIIILSLVIFSDIVPLRSRPRYVGIIQGAWAIGTCIGPIVGGGLATPSLWRCVFYLMFPFAGIGLVFVPLFVRLKPRKAAATWKEMFNRIDWLGGFLFISSATSFLIAVSWGGVQEPWGSWRTIVPLTIGGLGLIATMLWERFGALHPFLRHSLFERPSAVAVYACSFAQGLLLYGQLYYIPFFFESVRLDSPIRTGVSLLPVMLTLIPASVVVGSIITRLGHYRWAIWAGWTLGTLGTGLTILWDETTGLAARVIILVILGLGHGLLLNSLNTASQAVAGDSGASHKEDTDKGARDHGVTDNGAIDNGVSDSVSVSNQGSAVAMYAFLRSFGMAVGVGIGGSMFQNVMKHKLLDLGLSPEIAVRAESYIAVLRQMEPDSPARAAVTAAYVHGFKGVFGFFCALAGTALLVSVVFVRHYELNTSKLGGEHTLDLDLDRMDGTRSGYPGTTTKTAEASVTTDSDTGIERSGDRNRGRDLRTDLEG